MTSPSAFAELSAAYQRGDHHDVLRRSAEILAERPGDDAAHELRARSLLALNRVEEAEREAAAAVRLDPEEIRYRELLAEILARRGAHRDAADEFGRLARNDPRQADWDVAEAQERTAAAQPELGAEAARRAVRLDPGNARAQLALARGLVRTGDARGALVAARAAIALLPGDSASGEATEAREAAARHLAEAREALADALWLTDDARAAFREFRAMASELVGVDRARVTDKARRLYVQHAGGVGRLVARIGPLFAFALRRGWLTV